MYAGKSLKAGEQSPATEWQEGDDADYDHADKLVGLE